MCFLNFHKIAVFDIKNSDFGIFHKDFNNFLFTSSISSNNGSFQRAINAL